jgi:hypothetical protein
LKNARITVRGANEPVEISSAELHLSPGEARVEKLSAKAADTVWTGSLDMPRGCGTPGACLVHFNLNANQIALAKLSEWVNPRPKERPWYRVLESSASGPSFAGNLRASGRVTADRLQVQNLAATRVSASVSLDRGKVRVSELNADLLGGKHRGQWQADFGGTSAMCSGSGSLAGISLARLADTMKDPWIAGEANGSYEVKGECPADFWNAAEGTLEFEIKDGTLHHISLAEDAGALKVSRFLGKAHLEAGTLELGDAELDSPSGQFDVSGSASLNRDLDLKLARTPASTTAGYTVTGTLSAPRVVPMAGAETQARLKAEPAK